MRNRFDEQLTELHRKLIDMGAMCEEAIALSTKSLIGDDRVLAKRVAPVNVDIARAEREIESLCLKLLLREQPVANDLRRISAALKMITDMERIGDQAADIADVTLSLTGVQSGGEFSVMRKMAEATIKMVTDSIDAFVKEDAVLAGEVVQSDDTVDSLFCEVKSGLAQTLSKAPALAETAINRLMIAKYYERIGDHAVNIAKWVIFSVTGKHEDEGGTKQ